MERFLVLSPLHDALLFKQEEADLAAYVAELKDFPNFAVLEFLLHPLRLCLRDDKASSTCRQVSLQGIHVLLDRAPTIKTNLALVLADEVGKCLGDTGRSEESRLQAVQAMESLLRRHVPFSQQFWTAVPIRGLFGWILSQLLALAGVQEQLRSLRLCALNVAAYLFEAMQTEPRVAASFFPGYMSALQHVVCGDFKQGEALTTQALKHLVAAVVFVFRRGERDADPLASLRALTATTTEEASSALSLPSVSSASSASSTSSSASDEAFLTTMDQAWKQAASEKTNKLLDICVTYLHRCYCEERDEPGVRVAVAVACGDILLNCSNLVVTPQVLHLLTDTLILYAWDEWPLVRESTEGKIAQLKRDHRDEGLVRSARDSFQSAIISLPRQIRKSTDAEKQSRLKLVAGYARLMGPETLHLAMAVSQMRLVEAVLQVLTIDRTSLAKAFVAEEGVVSKRDMHIASQDARLTSVTLVLPVSLLYCSGAVLTASAFALCRELVCETKSAVIVLENVLDRIEVVSGNDTLAECVLLCCCIVSDCQDATATKTFCFRIFDVLLYAINEMNDPVTLLVGAYFVAVAARRLEGDFAVLVPRALPLLLRFLGNSDEKLSDVAWSGLGQMALAVGATSVHGLIRDNSDYIVDKVVRDLRAARGTDQVGQLSVLHGILRHSPSNASFLLDDILTEVVGLIDSSSKLPQQVCLFARVLAEIASALLEIVRDAPAPNPRRKEAGDKDKDKDKDNKEEEEEEEEENEFEKKPSLEQVIAAKLLDRARHFISARMLAARLDALSCVASCLQVLAQARKELLPAIYSVWDVLMKRLEAWDPQSDESNAVAAKVVSVLCVTTLGRDFLYGEKFERAWKSLSKMCDWALQNRASRPRFAVEAFRNSFEARLVAEIIRFLDLCRDRIGPDLGKTDALQKLDLLKRS